MMCVCVGYGCVCFLWVCGILAHNSCSSQVTAPFSRTYLAFLPWHDYHTPSTLGLATRNISIIPRVELEQRSRKEQLAPPPPYSLFFSPPPHPVSLPPHCLLLIPPPLQRRFLLPCNRNPLVKPFFSPPESAVCVCRHDWVIWQRHLFSDLLLGWGRKGRNGGVGGDKSRIDERRSSYETLSHYCMFPFYCFVWSFHAVYSRQKL